LSATRSADSLSDTLAGLRDGEPGWIKSVDDVLSHMLTGHGAQVRGGVRHPVRRCRRHRGVRALARLGIIAAVVAGAAIWVAQDFGELLTGQATDPNLGPLLVVIAAAFWPVVRLRLDMQPLGCLI
jgi:hypothetical protein